MEWDKTLKASPLTQTYKSYASDAVQLIDNHVPLRSFRKELLSVLENILQYRTFKKYTS